MFMWESAAIKNWSKKYKWLRKENAFFIYFWLLIPENEWE